jgi:hypothetical protein
MGLLRKAATAATRGDAPPEAPPAHEPEPERPRETSGLLRRSQGLRALESSARPAHAAELSVELVPEGPGDADMDETAIVRDAGEEPTPAAEPMEELPVTPAAEPTPAAAPEPVPPAELRPAARAVAEAPADARPTSAELISRIAAEVQALHGGVELPARLFTLVASRLSIQKGALLLYDPLRLVYAPWASKGYDQTTLHRLRIPLGASESWNALANGAPIVLSDPQAIAPYQQFFSSREFGSVSSLRLAPFIAEGKLIAVLLWSEASPPFDAEEALVACIARVLEIGSPLVHAARSAQLETTGDLGPRAEAAARDETARFVSAFNGRASVQLLSLSTEGLAGRVISSHEHLDPFRLHEDVRYFLDSFIADTGRAFSVRPGRFVIGLWDFEPADTDLLLHQLTLFLSGLFGVNGSAAGPASSLRILKTASWPDNGGDLRVLVESLSG